MDSCVSCNVSEGTGEEEMKIKYELIGIPEGVILDPVPEMHLFQIDYVSTNEYTGDVTVVLEYVGSGDYYA
jgi:hypothetical protein